jgi:ubiquitin-activating enzyme E1
MQDCVELAWATFHAQFRDRIASLIKALPADAKKKNGEAFWSGHRKFPEALTADVANDENVREFLVAGANLFACMLGVHGEKHPPVKNDPHHRWMAEYRTEEWIKAATSKLAAPELTLESVDDLDEETSSSAQAADVSDEEQERQFLALLEEVTALGSKLPSTAVPLDFEKDDDDNFHIDFVAAAANLRARNYRIATKDRLKVKMVAGKIIPAIATTTAAVTGIALMELFKVLQGKEISDLRNGMIDLGANIYTMFDREPPKKIKSYVKKTYDPETDYTMEEPIVAFPNPHTNYDKIVVEVSQATTMSDFVDALQAKTEDAEEGPYEVVGVGVGKGLLWNGMPNHKNFKQPLLAVIAEQLEQPADKFWADRRLYHRLAVNMESAEGNEVLPATVVIRIV